MIGTMILNIKQRNQSKWMLGRECLVCLCNYDIDLFILNSVVYYAFNMW